VVSSPSLYQIHCEKESAPLFLKRPYGRTLPGIAQGDTGDIILIESDSNDSKITAQTPKEWQPRTANDSAEWRCRPGPHLGGRHGRRLVDEQPVDLGFGRIIVSEKEAPNMLVILV
jgi:hypothetical protein